MGRKGANSSNRGGIKRRWGSNIPRIRTTGAKSRRRMGLVWGERDLRNLGISSNNRVIYFYFNRRIIATSHMLGGVIKKHCIALQLMGDTKEPDGDVPHGGVFDFLKSAGGLLNSESLDKKYG